MNKLLIFILVVLGVLNNMVAQQPTSNDSTEQYQYWVQRGIIEMVFAYMNDYVEAVGDASLNKSELDGKNKFEETFIININNDELADLNTVSTFLKSNNWKGAEAAILQPLFKKFKDTIPLKIDFFLTAQRNIGKVDNKNILVPIDYIPKGNYDINNRVFWNKKAEEIVKNYQKNLVRSSIKNKELQAAKELQIPPVVLDNNQPVKESSNSNPAWVKLLIYLMLFLFGLLVGGFLVFYISKTKIYSILSFEKNKYFDDLKMADQSFVFKYIGLFYILKKSKDDYKHKNEISIKNYDALIEKERDTSLQLNKLRSEKRETNSQIESIKSSETEGPVSQKWKINKQEENKHKLFFSMPESDGRFLVNNGETSNDGRKYYKIEYHESSEEGELYFIPSERDKRAINRLESYLKPACNIENIINADMATRIDFISPGKVVLMNDSWLIDSNRKVKIKLV